MRPKYAKRPEVDSAECPLLAHFLSRSVGKVYWRKGQFWGHQNGGRLTAIGSTPDEAERELSEYLGGKTLDEVIEGERRWAAFLRGEK